MNPIATALETRRAEAVERALEATLRYMDSIIQKLAESAYDMEAAFPRPKSTMSRPEYIKASERRSFAQSMTHSKIATRRHGDPDFVVVDCARLEAIANETRRHANIEFDLYIDKLTAKVGEPVAEAAINAAPLFNGSILTVTTKAGGRQVWKTKMIVNVSCLGKVFNQWPTRRAA